MKLMKQYLDLPSQKRLRQGLLTGLKEKGISDERVLRAMYHVPRQFFMDPADIDFAYMDKAFPIGHGQTISQPYTVAYQSQLLRIHPADRILEIGTGSAYQACVLAATGARVYSIERQKSLFERNMHFEYLKNFGNIQLFFGDGYEGLPQYAPFDKILVTAAAPEIPEQLLRQLSAPGIMVVPIGESSPQHMTQIEKRDDGELIVTTFDEFSFVPMLRGEAV